MSPNDTNPANPTPAGPAQSSPASGPVLGTDPNYPQYAVEFIGGSPSSPVLVTGPHTHTFSLQPGAGKVTVTLSRSPSDGVRPNLSITVS